MLSQYDINAMKWYLFWGEIFFWILILRVCSYQVPIKFSKMFTTSSQCVSTNFLNSTTHYLISLAQGSGGEGFFFCSQCVPVKFPLTSQSVTKTFPIAPQIYPTCFGHNSTFMYRKAIGKNVFGTILGGGGQRGVGGDSKK
jgi:hypothetical protein